ncbi:hypothetical protein ACIA5D_09910 [Actinoplanes sp. NPDC051513]|uniref:beta family protein n=1 Tax=Actinoplanes sp. NPDC051513 TaxID=3363908 RepID=UPI003794895E
MHQLGGVRARGRVEPLVRKYVAWARRYPWESITVAAGAMPKTLAGLPTNTATQIPRYDQKLWERLQEPDIEFGDYGIGHPAMSLKGWPPPRNLRYTDDDAWWIYRTPRDGNGNQAMHDLCDSLVASSHWPAEGADLSWGDRQIARCAEAVGGPGTPMLWRAWGHVSSPGPRTQSAGRSTWRTCEFPPLRRSGGYLPPVGAGVRLSGSV